MALGDGIRRNIASVGPTERGLFRDALIALNQRIFPGNRTDSIPGGVSWWFKQDEIHKATHVHGGPAFVPWHRELVHRLEQMLRQVNSQLSLHYWDWTQDPRAIPNAHLGSGSPGSLNLFTPDFMGYGGTEIQSIGAPWLDARFYVPNANPDRDSSGNPADPPKDVFRSVNGLPATPADDALILDAGDFPTMRGRLESVHNAMHGFVNMGGQHISFRDPFVFLLHSNVDRLFARWQTDPAQRQRLSLSGVYGSDGAFLDGTIPPWAGDSLPAVRPFAPPENQATVKTYKDPTVVAPTSYDTNRQAARLLVHLQSIGDVVVQDHQFGGTRGQRRRLEGFQLDIDPAIPGLGCRYMAHLQNIGDVPWVAGGNFVGTRGQSRRLEGFAIELTGTAAANYDVYYMAHLEGTGDTGFFSNGQFCGTRGQSRRVEGMLVGIKPKS